MLASLCVALPRFAEAAELVQTGRYTAVALGPTEAQREPLQAIVTVEFPEGVTTVGAAINHLLLGTGYALNDVLYWDPEVFGLFNHPLPDVQRTLGPITLLAALKTLAGPAFQLVIDPVHRLIAFELDPGARSLGFGDAAAREEAAKWQASF